MVCVIMNFRYTITKALKGRQHQHRATPCDWMTEPFLALKGRQQTMFRLTPFQVECKKCAITLQKSSSNNLYGKTSFLPNSKNKTTSVVNRIHLPEPDYLIFVDQLGNEVISDGRHLSTEVVLLKNEAEIRFSNLNHFENVFSKKRILHFLHSTYQGSNSRMCTFHRALPDAIAKMIRYEQNARIHLLATVAVIAAGFLLGLNRYEWFGICVAIGIVWSAEAFNTIPIKTKRAVLTNSPF